MGLDDIESSGGIGMTPEQANQLQFIYERIINIESAKFPTSYELKANASTGEHSYFSRQYTFNHNGVAILSSSYSKGNTTFNCSEDYNLICDLSFTGSWKTTRIIILEVVENSIITIGHSTGDSGSTIAIFAHDY